MIRVLLFFVAIGLAAFGLSWFAQTPGAVTIVWGATQYELSLVTALAGVALLGLLMAILWGLLRTLLRLPRVLALRAEARRREKGFMALTRGMLAVGAGDSRSAKKHAADAQKLIRDEPLTKLLRAQSAQLSGDRAGAVAAFGDMLAHEPTHSLGLRGLHVEARRRGDHEAALEFASRAHQRGALPWAGQAVLEARASVQDWAGALTAVETNAAARLIDKPAANRLRAVLKTAMAGDLGPGEAKAALALAQEAHRLAPGLIPAAVLAGQLSAASGDIRRATKTLETAYALTPHPDIARAYLRVRHGDSAADRLARARTLARLAPRDPQSLLMLGRAALEARDFAAARMAIAPLINDARQRPSVRACLLMADIEDASGAPGAAREWLARAARAPRDPAWVAEGFISDVWAPTSPAGKLDAYVWRTPDERLGAADAITPAPDAPAPIAIDAPAAPMIAPPAPVEPPVALAPLPEKPTLVVLDAAPRISDPFIAAAPDDPGPHEVSEPGRGLRLFSSR